MIGRILLPLAISVIPLEVVYSSDNFENAKVSGGVVKKNVRKDARNDLKKIKKKQGSGKLSDGRSYFISVGTSSINVASNNKNWGTARLIAFDRALLDSMRQCVEFQEVEITSTMER